MATSAETDTDNILLCSICLEKLNRPKYLPCLHTFCETCIQTYIASGFEKGNTNSFYCPICRFIVTSASENISPEEWASQLPYNFLIGGLLEKEKVQRSEKQCMSCERMDEQTEATVLCIDCSDTLCENCYKFHKVNKSSSGHEIKQLSDVSSDEQLPNAFNNNCGDHSSEKLKLFCVDDDVPCCSMCVSINHRKCHEIVSIEDAAKTYCATSKVKTIQTELEGCSNDISTLISEHKKCLTDLETQYETKVKEIEDFCKEIVDKIENFETQRKAEMSKLLNTKKDEIETKIMRLENRHEMVVNEKNIIEISTKKATEVQVMIESKKVLKHLEEHENLLTQKIYNFNLTLGKTKDIQTLTNQLLDTCTIECEEIPVTDGVHEVNKVEQLHRINRFKSVGLKTWHMRNSDYVNAISFSVSTEIQLLGFISFQCKSQTPCGITFTLREEGDKVLIERPISTQNKNDSSNTFDILLEKPLKINRQTKYDVVFKTNETEQFEFFKGENGQSNVNHEDIVFTFDKSTYNESSTNVLHGQIPGLIFQKC